jgi:hypothetical protein
VVARTGSSSSSLLSSRIIIIRTHGVCSHMRALAIACLLLGQLAIQNSDDTADDGSVGAHMLGTPSPLHPFLERASERERKMGCPTKVSQYGVP